MATATDQTRLAWQLQNYAMRGQHEPTRCMTRYKHDLNKMVENNEISTGPGRYALGVPNAYGNATYIDSQAMLMQKWGAAHDMTSTKTDVESDLRSLGRPGSRTVCGQYHPSEGSRRILTPMPEASFPRTFERLIDPATNIKGVGVNRWQWLGENPQANVTRPFEWHVDTRLSAKDPIEEMLIKGLPTAPSLIIPSAIPVARVNSQQHQFKNTALSYDGNPVVGAQYSVLYGGPTGNSYVPDHPDSVPSAPRIPFDRSYAQTGVLRPPPLFTTM